MIEPRGVTGSETQALMDVDRASGKSKYDTPPATPKKTPRGEVSPMPSRTNSPQQMRTPSEVFASPQAISQYPMDPTQQPAGATGAFATSSTAGLYPMGQSITPPEVALLNDEITELRKSLLNSEDSVRREELRCLNVWRNSEENARNIEITAHDEFVIMNGQLGQLRTELQESMQEDEGSSYRIQELERFRTLSEEVAAHINMKYQMLQSEHEQQMSFAQNIVGTMESQANLTVDELRSQLMNVHNRLTQEMSSYANLENAVQYESNMALQENQSVNTLHVELQEQRMANFQAKAEAERNMSRLENSLMLANKSRDEVVSEMTDMAYNHNAEVSEMNQRCETNEHELSLERAYSRNLTHVNKGLEQRCKDLEDSQDVVAHRDETLSRLKGELRIKDSSIKNYEFNLTQSRRETDVLRRQLLTSESQLSLQRPEMNSEVATLQAQVRQLKGEASELAAKGASDIHRLSITDKDIKDKGASSDVSDSHGDNDKIKRFIQELDDVKKEKIKSVESLEESHVIELRKVRDELSEMEVKKDKYKSYYTQLDEHMSEEEATCKAESEAYEKITNEYNEQVKELNELESNKSSRVSRKEFEKVTVPPWPKVEENQVWKSLVIQNFCIASGDSDFDAWEAWLLPAFLRDPNLDELGKTPAPKFQSIDSKLSLALFNMISQSGESGADVKASLRQRMQEKGKEVSFTRGREILAMVVENFRTTFQTEATYTFYHLHIMKYGGDNNLTNFYNRGVDVMNNMEPSNKPNDKLLEETLYRKIEGCQLMKFDLFRYESAVEGDEDRSYKYLLNMIKKHVKKKLEERLIRDKEKAVINMIGGNPKATPAQGEDSPNPKAKPKAKPKATPAAPKT
eukprot:s184_g21.t1